MYEKSLTDVMRNELIQAGVSDLSSLELVDSFMQKNSFTSVLLVNSVCGCAAGTARPAFIKSLAHPHRPLEAGTVFAGVDKLATNQARNYLTGYSPSSPAIAFFREGNLVYFLERNQIEGVDAQTLFRVIGSVYDKFFQATIQEDKEILDPARIHEMSPQELQRGLEEGIILLDCRDQLERSKAKIEKSIPLDQKLADEMIKNWDRGKKIVIHSHHGTRSREAVRFFKEYHFEHIYSLRGGIAAWSKEIDPSVGEY